MTLPTSLSGLLRLAVADCRKFDVLVAEYSYRFAWDMSDFLYLGTSMTSHEYSALTAVTPVGEVTAAAEPGVKCYVCMAGAVLACEQPGASFRSLTLPEEAPFRAIDAMRSGDFAFAWELLHDDEPPETFPLGKLANLFYSLEKANNETPVSEYLTWDQYDIIADALEAAGF